MLEKSKVPAGKKGQYEVRKFTVTEEAARNFNLECLMSYQPSRVITPGEYTKLVQVCDADADKGHLWMSDTPAELRDHYEAVSRARGVCLVNGLGLGVVVCAMLKKPEVTKMIVNELAQEVLDLVLPHLPKDPRLIVQRQDAFTWHPNGTRFNTVWHDIWDVRGEESHEESKRLCRRYGQWLQKPHWQGSWGRWASNAYYQ